MTKGWSLNTGFIISLYVINPFIVYICPVINEQVNVALLLNSVLTSTVTIVSVQPRKNFSPTPMTPKVCECNADCPTIAISHRGTVSAHDGDH